MATFTCQAISHFLRKIMALPFCGSLSVITFTDVICWVEYVICLISLLLWAWSFEINMEKKVNVEWGRGGNQY